LRVLIPSLLFSLLPVAVSPCQSACPLVADINTKASAGFDSNPRSGRYGPGAVNIRGYLNCGPKWFFVASNAAAGEELWITDGTTTGTALVKDIRPGIAGSDIKSMVCCAGKVYFSANDGTSGAELWVSDGTATGTTMVRDIHSGSNSSSPLWLACLSTRVYFAATTSTNGAELWRSDGSATGTVLVRDIFAGTSSSSPKFLRSDPGGKFLLFQASDGRGAELWKTNGTPTGTALVKDINAGAASSLPTFFLPFGNTTLFRAATRALGTELWRTDGTATGTVLVKDIRIGSSGGSPALNYSKYATFGGAVYFPANNGANGIELWKTDGTTTGTVQAADVAFGSQSSSPRELFAHGTSLFFSAYTSGTGREVWRLSSGKVSLVADLNRGSWGSNPAGFHPLGAKLLFSATSLGLNDFELWSTDGTATGTTRVRDIFPGKGGSRPDFLTSLSATKLMFSARGANFLGKELFETDGTLIGTKVLKDIDPRRKTGSSEPWLIGSVEGRALLFSAYDGAQYDIYLHDRGVPRKLKPGRVSGSEPKSVVNFWNGSRNITLFTAQHPTSGAELWRSDGTASGTFMVKDLNPGSFSSNPSWFTSCGDKVLFEAYTGTSGSELWITNGIASGTRLLKDISPGSQSSAPRDFLGFRGKVYFQATERGSRGAGNELWVSDGTPTGTKLLKDISSPGDGNPAELTLCGYKFVFAASDAARGRELWISDGTTTGTTLLKDVQTGTGDADPTHLTKVGKHVYFVADDGTRGIELWRTDLTTTGTVLVKDLRAGSSSSQPKYLTASQGKLFFSAVHASFGRELHVSDGTAAGTRMVKDLLQGDADPKHFVSAGNGVYFVVKKPTGTELYFSDGTAANTKAICTIYPRLATYPYELMVCAGKVYLAKTTALLGKELHYIGGTPATSESIDVGCGPNQPSLRSTNPVAGRALTIEGDRSPTSGTRVLVVGAPSRPVHVPGLVATGCGIWPDLALPIVLAVPPAGKSWTWRLPIPAGPSLIGVSVVMQAAYEPTPLSLSNPVRLTIGN
jgi:ELWxxDGT repeat protein